MENKKFIFATDDKNLYDIFYEKKISFSPELSKFPALSDFNSEADLEYAAHLWRKQIKEKIKNKIMPVPLSLSVYTPEVANLPNSSFSNNLNDNTIISEPNVLSISGYSKYFDYRSNPPLPITFPEIFDKIITQNSTNDGKSTLSDQVVHIRNQKTLSINTYIQKDQKWGSSLIPQEPSPELFDSYESYKKSLKNWVSIKNKELSLQHPSEFISSIGIPHIENDSIKSNTNNKKVKKLSLISTYGYKIFNEKDFLNMKSKNTPPSPLLIQIFSLSYQKTQNINSMSIIKYSNSSLPKFTDLSNSLPFKAPYTRKVLIGKVHEMESSNFESTRIIRMLKTYRIITDPYIAKTIITNIEAVKMTLFSDFSAIQTAESLKKLTSQQYDALTKSLPFFLHQLHVIKSNRVRCRFFIIISNILETHPKLISTFFTDVQTLSNVASIIADFSFLDSRIYLYEDNFINESDSEAHPPTKPIQTIRRKSMVHSISDMSASDSISKVKSNFTIRKSPTSKQNTQSKPSEIKKSVNDLLFFLFANQLLKVLMYFVEKYQPKNRNLLLQINAQTMTFSRFIDMSLTEKLNDIESSFLTPTPKNCTIFHFLCDYNPVSLSKIFQSNPFYIFLGKVHMSSSTKKYFGEMCGHVLRIPKLRRLFFLQFFHIRCLMTSKNVMITMVPTLNFLSSLIKQETETDFDHDVSFDELFTSFTNVTQLVFFSPSSSLNLIGSIINFFLRMKHQHKNVPTSPQNMTVVGGNNSPQSPININSNSSALGAVLNSPSPIVNLNPNVQTTTFSSNFDSLSNKTFTHIRESLITLFMDPNLDSNNIVVLYELMSMMIIPYRNDTKSFIDRYLSTIVMTNMKSSDETIAVASWDVFRELFFDQNFQFLREQHSIKANLSLIVSSKRNLLPPVLIEILFLALGVTNKMFSFSSSESEREMTKKKKSRRSINLFDQPEGFVIPGINPREIYQDVLKYYAEGKLKDFKNEILTLKIMMPNFKWRKRTISCV